ncbi:LacI family DNA-binding transcriptional regulator [Paracoccus seriniphilus]|uniref:Transcriptional regulator, LacI family n=1 Tax=Paracoccus seriniphilus TaxID=184748 RepID=A0A239PTZ1_9RHOB|nr:LacI family DNA-binding transcriptional regulator [Paracoccus seriniphilus]WCR16555.1 LacI family DNA-binding transcriptional regulator [Paracoccus seriniphilus]SNT73769.1 transcriptional regulator, LacI family [Paracoccus seriniphilus]
MATIKDVAREAGVSVGTVSKVISRDATVKPALRERVLKAIATLGYRPNLAARALRTNTVNVIGLVVPDISNPFFAALAKRIEAEAAKYAHSVMLANSDDDPEAEARQIAALLGQLPKGLIIVGAETKAVKTVKSDVPIVSVDRRYGAYPLIATNHETASALQADHLVALGHRRIGYISGPDTTEVGRLRKQGFYGRIMQLSDPGDPVRLIIREGSFDYTSGELLARAMLELPPDERPTAIAAASDQQAIGALRLARDMGIEVPARLSIAGFDNIDLAKLVVPRLTSVAQRIEEIAVLAVQRILNPGQTGTKPADVLVGADLVARGSSGPAPNAKAPG